MEQNGLIKSSNELVARVGNQIEVTNKLLSKLTLVLIPYRKKVGVDNQYKWGFCTTDKKIVIECIYDEVSFFSNGVSSFSSKGLAQVLSNGLLGFIDTKGHEIIKCQYDELGWFYDDLAFFKKNDYYGFINKVGSETIKAVYSNAESFVDGLAIVRIDVKRGIINTKGEVIIDFKYREFTFTKSSIHIVAELDDKCYLFNKNGLKLSENAFDKLAMSDEGIGIAKLNNKVCLVNEIGEITKYLDYANFSFSGFKNGYCLVNNSNFGGNIGYVDINGDLKIPFDYQVGEDFSEDIAEVVIDENGTWKTGFINKQGETIIPFIFSSGKLGGFKNGYLEVKIDKKWGVIDKKGNFLIPCKYDVLNSDTIKEGVLIAFKLNNKWGYINLNDEIVIPAIYDWAGSFSENGLAQVMIDDQLGCINKKGAQYWED